MAVTIKDIAQKAGVSHTTVSRALRNHPAIAPATITHIQAIADSLGYIPNSVARDLKNARSSVLGVIVRRLVDPFFSEVLEGIESVASQAGFGLFLASTNRDPDKEKSIIRIMSEHRLAGVIICSTAAGESHRAQLSQFGVPSVLVNSQAAEDLEFSVFNDNIFGTRRLVRHLVDLGHRRIAYLGNALAGRATDDRLTGFRQEMAACGLDIPPAYLVNGHNGRADGGAAAAEQLGSLPDPPTAIVCYNDIMAIGAVNTLQKHGLRVPEDCSITGFDNIEIAPFVTPALTTFDQPKVELGRQAALLTLKLLDGAEKQQPIPPAERVIVLRGRLIVRGSTAPPVPIRTNHA